ncbi:hypothetical protein DFR24_4828 [Panacagrimonas perspica]|uniref:Lipoprotein n=1 Tax=Panacagrimonas perspica TaxID=381431 RepID=A0A4R7NQR3_9GAMM|nr:hypothetical protein [Panacagrimonas perspica]TDU23304.1 hypothetical protein DFR24_4828 [Panacagrimonas perspica]THD02497.1 hypothetical protein B1810_14325 [Panacagrimonas perspica]
MIKTISSLLILLLLTACSSAPKIQPAAEPPPVWTGPMRDYRPVTERESTIFSTLITRAGYGIYRTGEDKMSPTGMYLLRRKAQQKLGADGKKPLAITVHHLVVYVNAKTQLRKTTMGGVVAGAVGGAVVAQSMDKMTVNLSQSVIDSTKFTYVENEYERAFYTEEENLNRATVYVIYIEADINGKRTFTKTMASAKEPFPVVIEASVDYFLSHY